MQEVMMIPQTDSVRAPTGKYPPTQAIETAFRENCLPNTKSQKKGTCTMPLQLTIPQVVAGETTYASSVAARVPFTATIKMLNTNGSVNTSFNGTIYLYANSPTDDRAFSLGTATLSSGSGSASGLVISRIYNLSASRRVTAVSFVSGYYAETYVDVGVWFKGDASWYNDAKQVCDNQGTRPVNYIALPGASLCNKNIRVYNPNTSQSATGKVWDVGPFFDSYCCNYDEYWYTGTAPKSVTYKGQMRFTVCGSSCSGAPQHDDSQITGAIIDISPEMRNSLGASGTITNAYWRFA
jgi:hypothetical protein